MEIGSAIAIVGLTYLALSIIVPIGIFIGFTIFISRYLNR